MKNYHRFLMFALVKPDASPEEIRAVVNDTQGGQIFSQAVRANVLVIMCSDSIIGILAAKLPLY